VYYALILRLLVLLTLANGSPVVAKWLFGNRFAPPLDADKKFADGRPIFGRSKTLRGLCLSLLVTAGSAPLFGFPMKIGLLIAATAMAGDLFSSFLKRRLGLLPGDAAPGLDQIPESLFPLLAASSALSLTVLDIFAGTALFAVAALVSSRLLFKLHVRDKTL